MKNLWLITLVSAAVSSVCTQGQCEELGQQGVTSLGADRLSGLYMVNTGNRAMQLGVGAAPVFAPQPYTSTRFAIDHFISPSLSLGGTLAFWLKNGPDIEGRRNRANGYLVAPRVGYVLPITDGFGFWPRGGFNFWDLEVDDEFGITAEATFYGALTNSFGLTFGPTADLGIVGEGNEGVAWGLISFGLLGWL
ncbi:MAG: hypothetical protein SFV15_09455 [Polyangiaceae bacterium]|nr:hypothetical protein [Polyangiaceae bacterium]